MFRDFHRRRRSYLKAGSSTDADQDDTNMYRCKVCGAVCDAKTTEVAGERKSASAFLSGTKILTDADSDYYPSDERGCWFCGTLYSRDI